MPAPNLLDSDRHRFDEPPGTVPVGKCGIKPIPRTRVIACWSLTCTLFIAEMSSTQQPSNAALKIAGGISSPMACVIRNFLQLSDIPFEWIELNDNEQAPSFGGVSGLNDTRLPDPAPECRRNIQLASLRPRARRTRVRTPQRRSKIWLQEDQTPGGDRRAIQAGAHGERRIKGSNRTT
jgi:hypothetical protein